MNAPILWQPSPERAQRSTMAQFERFVGETRGLAFSDYNEMWAWSVSDLAGFWSAIWEFFEIQSSTPYEAVIGAEIMPGPSIQTEDDIANWIRANVETDFHPCGTCRMGSGDDTVVDPEFRVHGVDGLRVVDASVFPRITSANLNAPTQMAAARAADYIAGPPQKPPLTL